PFAEAVAGDQDLADDLAGGEIAHQLLGAGVTEAAGQGTADLARNAQGAAVFLGDVDGLDLLALAMAIGAKPQEPFARAVARDLLGGNFRALEGEAFGKAGPELLADVGHAGKGHCAAIVDPVPE